MLGYGARRYRWPRRANTSELYRYFNQRLLRLIMPYIIHTERRGVAPAARSDSQAAWIGRRARLTPAIIVAPVNRVYTNNGWRWRWGRERPRDSGKADRGYRPRARQPASYRLWLIRRRLVCKWYLPPTICTSIESSAIGRHRESGFQPRVS